MAYQPAHLFVSYISTFDAYHHVVYVVICVKFRLHEPWLFVRLSPSFSFWILTYLLLLGCLASLILDPDLTSTVAVLIL